MKKAAKQRKQEKDPKPQTDVQSDDEKYKAYDEAVECGEPLQEYLIPEEVRRFHEELNEYHAVSPRLSGGDVDADWQDAESSGEETVGGTVATPDQDIVDELGRAVGMEFQDNQPLRSPAEVLDERDHHRWELNRSSADSDPAQQEE
jgi:hypothetical protein